MPAEPTPFSRSTRMLRTALGPDIGGYLEDPDIVEVMLNPDGRLWIDRLSSGLEDTGRRIPVVDGERIVRLVAHHVGAEAHAGCPRVSAELPETGERFEGLLPPVEGHARTAMRCAELGCDAHQGRRRIADRSALLAPAPARSARCGVARRSIC